MPIIIFAIIYIAWKCFYFSSITQEKESAPGCGCLLFFIFGGMFLLVGLLGALS